MKQPPNIFDKSLLRKRLDRVAVLSQDHGAFFLHEEIASRLVERLDFIKRRFSKGLGVGSFNGCLKRHLEDNSLLPEFWAETELSQKLVEKHSSAAHRLVADSEIIPFANKYFDLVISFLNLHWVNDVPGALAQIQMCLQQDGLLLGALFGGETLFELKECLGEAEESVKGGVSPRFSPMIGVRDAGSLLQRAGFALPVVDLDKIKVTYPSLKALLADVRSMGAANALHMRSSSPLTQEVLVLAEEIYQDRYADAQGGLTATFDVIFLAGWSPAPSQPKALKPGSGQISLESVL